MQSKLASEFELKYKETVPKHFYFNMCVGLFCSCRPPPPPTHPPIIMSQFSTRYLISSDFMVLFQQVQHFAEDYTNRCIGPDTNSNHPSSSSSSTSTSGGGGGGCAGPAGRPSVIMSISGSARSVSGREECEVYVWGSNNSHQLAEGSQEKILAPKLTSSFSYVQQVSTLFFSFFGWDYTVRSFKESFELCCFVFGLLGIDQRV